VINLSKDIYLLSEIDLQEYNLGIIYPPTVKDVIRLKREGIEYFLAPFVYKYTPKNTEDSFFESLFMEEELEQILYLLSKALKTLYKTEDIKINMFQLETPSAIINNSNFDKLCEIIKDLFFIEELKSEARSIQVSKENQGLLEEFLELEKQQLKEEEEQNKKNQRTIHQIAVALASQMMWDYEAVLNMTYYRFRVTYESIIAIDNFRIFMQYKSSGQFDMKNEKQEYWMNIVGK
jgi:hypothetical protein